MQRTSSQLATYVDVARIEADGWKERTLPPELTSMIVQRSGEVRAWSLKGVMLMASVDCPTATSAVLILSVSNKWGKLRGAERFLTYALEPYRAALADFSQAIKSARGADAKWMALLSVEPSAEA